MTDWGVLQFAEGTFVLALMTFIGWLLVDVAIFRWLWPARKEIAEAPVLIRRAKAVFLDETCPHCGREL